MTIDTTLIPPVLPSLPTAAHGIFFLVNIKTKAIPRVLVMGTGYVGLTTAVGLASRGIPAVAFEIDPEKRDMINSGEVPFFEPSLSDLLKESLQRGFHVSDRIETSDITIITVGTPSRSDGSIDLTYVKSASEMLGRTLENKNDYHVVVVKSTVVPGTTENVVRPAVESCSRRSVGSDLGLVMNPEFLREGSAVKDMFEPDRIVIGESDTRAGDAISRLYEVYYGSSAMPPVLRTSIVNAEFIKYASNAFLATKISYINTIANIAQKIPGADVEVIAKGIGMDRRIGRSFLNAGLGFGGSCFPKDVNALIALSRTLGYEPVLLQDVEGVNYLQFEHALEEARVALGESFEGKTITLLGLAFKPETDDIREAVSLRIIESLLSSGASIRAYDPAANGNVARRFPTVRQKISYLESAKDALQGSDCCIIVTEWDEFRKLEPEDFISSMRTPVLIDGRRIYDPVKFRGKMKFSAIGLGGKESIAIPQGQSTGEKKILLDYALVVE